MLQAKGMDSHVKSIWIDSYNLDALNAPQIPALVTVSIPNLWNGYSCTDSIPMPIKKLRATRLLSDRFKFQKMVTGITAKHTSMKTFQTMNMSQLKDTCFLSPIEGIPEVKIFKLVAMLGFQQCAGINGFLWILC